MTNKEFVVDSASSYLMLQQIIEKVCNENKVVTFRWSTGKKRSLDQNALMHVWLTEYAAHLMNKAKANVTEVDIEAMKRVAKLEYWQQFHFPHSVVKVTNPRTGQVKTDVSSSKTWTQGEMFHFMEWLQGKALSDGLILESKGEFKQLQDAASQ